ncbi:hypothetical protein HY994_02870 [Candidatus Micrarchaeota archaeon]|nr:hypothetical protein [Candidatus Micrarchaeota archaeon]
MAPTPSNLYSANPASGPISAAVPVYLHPAFWAIVSILASFGLTYLLLHRPRKWWVLLVALAAAFVLFGIFGLGGFLAGVGLKLWQNKDGPVPAVLAKEIPKKPESVQAQARKKRRKTQN